MYGIFTYIWLICMVNLGKYTVHGSYGNWLGRFKEIQNSLKFMKECSLATLFSSHNVCIQKLPMLCKKRWKPLERLRRGARVQPWFSSMGFDTKVGEITCGAFFSQLTQVSNGRCNWTRLQICPRNTFSAPIHHRWYFLRQISGSIGSTPGALAAVKSTTSTGAPFHDVFISKIFTKEQSVSFFWRLKGKEVVQFNGSEIPFDSQPPGCFLKALVNKQIFTISTSDCRISEPSINGVSWFP